ncbi:MAG: hypothetical protein HYZ63_00955 [Candidatus Andersenbacteria bacterium]|nr:hypothetical protein [Candidatus Andersenbacteria bacterium]
MQKYATWLIVVLDVATLNSALCKFWNREWMHNLVVLGCQNTHLVIWASILGGWSAFYLWLNFAIANNLGRNTSLPKSIT